MRRDACGTSGTDRRISLPILVLGKLFVAGALLAACTPPFPGPPETLPDCDFQPATEFCGIVKDSARREAPFSVSDRNEKNFANSESTDR
jgi:hypothetical protein